MNVRRNPKAAHLSPAEREAVLHAGLRLYNSGEHWHAHEAWEPLWMDLEGPEKLFVQGLIMSAAMLHQHERRVVGGVRNHWSNVRARLEPHRPTWHALDVDGLLAQLEPFVADAESGRWALHASQVRLNPAS